MPVCGGVRLCRRRQPVHPHGIGAGRCRRGHRKKAGGGGSLYSGGVRPAGSGAAGLQLLRQSCPADDHGGHYGHQRQDFFHLASQAGAGAGSGSQGRPGWHHGQYDRTGNHPHRAHHAGKPGFAGSLCPDAGRGLHPCDNGGFQPCPDFGTGGGRPL